MSSKKNSYSSQSMEHKDMGLSNFAKKTKQAKIYTAYFVSFFVLTVKV